MEDKDPVNVILRLGLAREVGSYKVLFSLPSHIIAHIFCAGILL